MNKHSKKIPNSEEAYARLKLIADAAQAGGLNPWGPSVIRLLNDYGIKVDRKKDIRLQTNLSFPSSKKSRSMAIGIRHMKVDGSFAEDLFVFDENAGLTSYYRGSQEEALPEYSGSHHAKIVLSEFLPDIKRDIEDLKQKIRDAASNNERIPELHLQLHGSGAKRTFEGHIAKKTDDTLVIISISIGGSVKELNQQFTRLLPLKDLKFDPTLFDKKQQNIEIKVHYRNLVGEAFEYFVRATQQQRQSGSLFNIVVDRPPTIKRMVMLTDEANKLIEEAKKHSGQIYHLSTDQVPGGWIRVGKKDYYFEKDQNKTRSYVRALESLVQSNLVEHQSGRLYLLK